MAKHLLKATSIWLGLLLFSSGCWSENPRMMKVETGHLSEISYTAATISGSVVDVGESGLEAYGHCWSTSSGPSYDLDQKTQLGRCDTMGIYLSQLTDLEPDTKYFVRSYAKSGGDVVYGNEITFSSRGGAIPLVISNDIINYDYTSVTCGGTISDDRGSAVISRGICYGTEHLPTIEGQHTSVEGGSLTFTSTLTGLTEGESYYYRAYASNGFGTAYGEEIPFTTRVHAPTIIATHAPQLTAHSCSLELEASGLLIEEKGICYSTQSMPTIEEEYLNQGPSAGKFSINILGLDSRTTYFLRPYAINPERTVYGEQIEITSPSMVFDLRVTPMEMYDGCGEDGKYQGPGDHEATNYIMAQIKGQAEIQTLADWYNTLKLFRNEWNSISQDCTPGVFSIDETQSIIVSFDIWDWDESPNKNDPLDVGWKEYSMQDLIELSNFSPGIGSYDSITIARDSAMAGACLKMTCKFEFTEE